MCLSEFVIIIIKPDALVRGFVQEICNGLEMDGLDVVETGVIKLDLQLVMDFYQWSKIDHPDYINGYLCSDPLPVWIASGHDAIIKAMMLKSNLRKKYCDGLLGNLFHCSSSQDEALWEYNILKNKGVTMKELRTKNQVEAIVFKTLATGELSFLMLKRTPERGGFWQPVTGNVKVDEPFEVAALREVEEELGVTAVMQLIDTGYSYEFHDNNLDQFERVFGVEVSVDQTIQLSSEHTEYCWTSKEDALNVYLKYPGNKEGLRWLYKKIAGNY